MILIGQHNQLTVSHTTKRGAWLTDGQTEVLLPQSKVPVGLSEGDTLRVFVHTDSEDRVVATTDEPLATVGEIRMPRGRRSGRARRIPRLGPRQGPVRAVEGDAQRASHR